MPKDIFPSVLNSRSIQDVTAERVTQIENWDASNAKAGFCLDNYIGIAQHYIGGATCSYHNDARGGVEDVEQHKRTNLIKAAAVLLQAVDRIDDGTLQPGRDF